MKNMDFYSKALQPNEETTEETTEETNKNAELKEI
jgi:hypothetical protein